MKIECEVCHVVGYLQQLGNYYRIRHYQGIDKVTGKSKFFYHPQSREYALCQIDKVNVENFKTVNSTFKDSEADHNNTEIKAKCSSGLDLELKDSSTKLENQGGCSLAWFRTSACHVDDPGSNPGNRTIYFSCHPLAECRRWFHVPKNKILKKRNRDGYGRFVLLFLFLIRISPATTATTTTITMIM